MSKDTEKIARRYGKAFAEVVMEMRGEKTASEIGTTLENLSLLGENDVGVFFSHPVFNREEKRKVLDAFAKKQKMDPLVHRFLQQPSAVIHNRSPCSPLFWPLASGGLWKWRRRVHRLPSREGFSLHRSSVIPPGALWTIPYNSS